MEKPHLVLYWVLDVPNQILSCKIADDCMYIAHKGGVDGYTKIYKGEETLITPTEWSNTEKFWISENYGDIHGYYQPDINRIVNHVKENRPEICINGVGPDNRYLDHMQRMQAVMEGDDCTTVFTTTSGTRFVTPDGGLTILKHVTIDLAETLYPDEVKNNPNELWITHPQPCAMQPLATGRLMSSHEEMEEAGVHSYIINKCKEGKWDLPEYPDLFEKSYIY